MAESAEESLYKIGAVDFESLTLLPDFSFFKHRAESEVFNYVMIHGSPVLMSDVVDSLTRAVRVFSKQHALNAIIDIFKRGRISICFSGVPYLYLDKFCNPVGNVLTSFALVCPICNSTENIGFIVRPRCANSREEKIQYRHNAGIFCFKCFEAMKVEAKKLFYKFYPWSQFTETDMD